MDQRESGVKDGEKRMSRKGSSGGVSKLRSRGPKELQIVYVARVKTETR